MNRISKPNSFSPNHSPFDPCAHYYIRVENVIQKSIGKLCNATEMHTSYQFVVT